MPPIPETFFCLFDIIVLVIESCKEVSTSQMLCIFGGSLVNILLANRIGLAAHENVNVTNQKQVFWCISFLKLGVELFWNFFQIYKLDNFVNVNVKFF